MVRDPKQWLLLHGEKVVFAVMVLLLVLVVSVYRPWSIEVPAKEDIRTLTEKAEILMKEGDPNRKLPPLVPPDYRIRVEQFWREPWKDYRAPDRRPLSTAAIWSPFSTILPGDDKRPTPLPPVLTARRVVVRAERGESLIMFDLDDFEENRQLQQLGVPEYQGGLEFDHIEVLRINRATGETAPVTPPNWLPEGLPARYGAPPRNLGVGTQLHFAEPVYLFAQRAPGPDEDRLRREMEDLRRQRDEIDRRGREEADRQEQERRRRAEEDRKRREEAERARTETGKPPTRT
ncbi:MAG TPA: hypothetical protein VMX57_07245, partial [Planctomycetota bacterium]|nr:hypothetical protein [Planctomycetota bacterium]